MKFFDLHINGENFDSDLILLSEAKRLGYAGAAIVYPAERYLGAINVFEKLRKLEEFDGFEIASGVMVDAKNPEEMRKTVNTFRKKADIIYVAGGDIKINRAACENSRVDVLSSPYTSRRDAGINHVFAREAKKNNVAIELKIVDIISSWLKVRTRLLEYFREIVKLQRKFHFPLAVTSGAGSIYDLRTPRDIVNFSSCFGLSEDEAVHSISKIPPSIISHSRESHTIIAEGVRLIKER